MPGRQGERLGAGDGVSENGEGAELKLDLAPVRRDVPKVGRNEPCPLRQRQEIQELLRPLGVARRYLFTVSPPDTYAFGYSVAAKAQIPKHKSQANSNHPNSKE